MYADIFHTVRIVLWDARSVCMETIAVTKTSARKRVKTFLGCAIFIYILYIIFMCQILKLLGEQFITGVISTAKRCY